MWLNWTVKFTPISTLTPSFFQVYPPFLAKNFVPPPPSDSIFVRSYPPSFNKRGGGGFQLWAHVFFTIYSTVQHLLSAVTFKRSLTYCNAGGSKMCFSISLDILISDVLSSAPETNWNKSNYNFISMDGTTNKFKKRFNEKNQLFTFGKLSWY